MNIFDQTKAASRGDHRKKCFENMQQIYWRTPLSKCDFIEITNMLKLRFGMGVLP